MSVRMNFEHELETLRENMDAMGKGIQQAFADLLSAIAFNNLEELDRIQKNDRKINEMERKIEAECLLLLTRQQPVLASDLRIVSSVMKAVGDMERIGDHAVNISEWEVFKETGSIKNERILPESQTYHSPSFTVSFTEIWAFHISL